MSWVKITGKINLKKEDLLVKGRKNYTTTHLLGRKNYNATHFLGRKEDLLLISI